MKKLFIVSLFVLFVFVFAGCSEKENDTAYVGSTEYPRIMIVTSKSIEFTHINCDVSVKNVITNDEITLFGLQDQQLKSAINNYFGKAPNDAYLKSPTPWNDLYKTYGWNQVERISNIISYRIISLDVEEVILKTENFMNQSENAQIIDIGYKLPTIHEVKILWNNAPKINFGDPIVFSIDFDLNQPINTVTFNASYNQTKDYQYSRTMGSSNEIQHSIEPDESINVDLVVNKYRMVAEIDMETRLIGFTAVNYNPTYKDHHFWNLSIASVMHAGSIPNNITSTIQVELIYYDYVRMDIHS